MKFSLAIPGAALLLVANIGALASRAEEIARYIWIDVPYSITSPGMTFGGDVNCYGGSSSNTTGYGQGQVYPSVNGGLSGFGSVSSYSSTSSNANCTQTPSYSIPSSTSSKVLRVQVDCLEKTYDAQGDGKGWGPWGNEAAVYERAAYACSSQNDPASPRNLSLKWESVKLAQSQRREEESKAIKAGTYTVDKCIFWSSENLNDMSPFFKLKPDGLGLNTKAQVTRFVNILLADIASNCKGELRLLSSGGSPEAIKAYWLKKHNQVVERVLKGE